MKRIIMSARYAWLMLALVLATSCATTTPLQSGSSSLSIRVMPDPGTGWKTARIYLNEQCVDTAIPDHDKITFSLAPGKYDVKVILAGYETCEETVSLIEGRQEQYIEFHPKKALLSPLTRSIQRFFSN